MALKELGRPVRQKPVQIEEKVNKFISKGGSLADSIDEKVDGDHRLTLRIPQWLMDKVDAKRKKRVGKISRNLLILEILEKAAKE
jgi:hypothetical protein